MTSELRLEGGEGGISEKQQGSQCDWSQVTEVESGRTRGALAGGTADTGAGRPLKDTSSSPRLNGKHCGALKWNAVMHLVGDTSTCRDLKLRGNKSSFFASTFS